MIELEGKKIKVYLTCFFALSFECLSSIHNRKTVLLSITDKEIDYDFTVDRTSKTNSNQLKVLVDSSSKR